MNTRKIEDLLNLKCSNENVLMLERLIYAYAYNLSGEEYLGGIWTSESIELENNIFWYYKLNDKARWEITCENHLEENNVSTKCFSILSFTFALNHLMSIIYEDENEEELLNEIVRLYNAIRYNIDNLLDEKERKIFFQVID